MFEDIFKFKVAIPSKLEGYGFKKNGDVYRYSTFLLDNEFSLEVTFKGAVFDTKLIEASSGEEYVLYKTNASGAYVGQIREAIRLVLEDIASNCFEVSAFQKEQTKALIEHVREKHQDKLEHLWERTPENAIWRRKDNRKWYAVIMAIPAKKLGFASDEIAEVADLRGNPNEIATLIDRKTYFPAWHMNKKNWYTILLDGTLPDKELFARLEDSYNLAKKAY